MVFLLGMLLISSAACALSARSPRQAPNEVPIISFINEHNLGGSYRYSYETGNGISVQEEGFLSNAGQGEGVEAQSARGSYSYPSPDGQQIQVTWYADETGFHAEGDHIPKGPTPTRLPGQPGQPGSFSAPGFPGIGGGGEGFPGFPGQPGKPGEPGEFNPMPRG